MRTIVDLPEKSIDRLAELCRREKISRAEAVRRAVERYLESTGAQTGTAVFGIWKGRDLDPLIFEDRIRDEWDRGEGGH